MRVCVLGGDGYLGWPTCMHMSGRGHDVLTIDNYAKRSWEAQMGVHPLLPIPDLPERIRLWQRHSNRSIEFLHCDVSTEYATLEAALRRFAPDAIIHYAEQPSAPFSMASRETAIETQRNNVLGTLNVLYACRAACPDAHIIKLGTMGEYGTPNIDIEEGWIDIEHNGRRDRVLFPKRPTSIYHLSKVHDSANLEFACRTWGISVTDINQGVVYGIEGIEDVPTDELRTSFHYDSVFGTVLNRFVVQAVAAMPLTIYGNAGKVRSTIDLRDSIRCVELAALNPPKRGEFRIFNQFTECFSLKQMAESVAAAGQTLGLEVTTTEMANPRVEKETHYYNPKHTALEKLGLKPHLLTTARLAQMMENVMRHRAHLKLRQVEPQISWG